jgi:uncharacterized protein (TIGR02996 family)
MAENPEDDALRLIYADWLEEHGRPERAEFIRVQIRLSKLDADEPEHVALSLREQELIEAHCAEWVAATVGKLTVTRAWVRGMLDEVLVRAAVFCAEAEALLRAAPTARWRVMAEDWSAVRDLVRCPQFPRLRRLALVGGRIAGAGARILAESRGVSGLRELDLRGNSLGQPGTQALAMSGYLRELRALDLSENNLSRSSIPILVSSSNLPGLRRLSLGRNLLGNSDVRAIATAKHWPNLRELDLSGNAIDNEGAEALAASPLMRQLVRIDLFDTDVTMTGARKLGQAREARPELRVGHGKRE